jgi:EmrB/QacA subfamily drug resistance transporter
MTQPTKTSTEMSTEAPPPNINPATDMPHLDQQQITLTVVGLLLGVFLAALDQTIVSTAGPIIQRELNISAALFPWLTTIYLLSSTVMVPVWGKLSDLYGRKSMFLLGIGIFLLGSVLCGISQDGIQLVLARGVQGFGGAALFTVGLSIIADIFPPQQRAKFSGLFGMLFGISSIVGPLVGGYLSDNISWHWIFFVNLPLGALAIAFIAAKMPPLKRDWGNNRPSIDWAGVFWLFLGTIPLLLALSLGKNTVEAGQSGFEWTSWQILSMFAVALIGIVGFIITERRVKDPLVDLKLFQNPSFAWGNLAAFVAGSAFLAAIVFLPLFMVNVVGLSATSSGLTTLPLTFGLVLANIMSGQIAARIGKVKPIILGALIILLIGFALMGFTLTTETTQLDISWKMFLVGVGLGPSIPLFTLAIQNAVQPREIGVATAMATFSRSLGTTMGVGILGSVFAAALSSELASKMTVIKQDLPAAMQKQFDAFGKQGGNGGGEGGGQGEFPNIAKVKLETLAKMDAQKITIAKALQNNDPAAVKELLANAQTPQQLRDTLEAGGIKASITKALDLQYQSIAKVINSGDPTAFAALKVDPKLSEGLRKGLGFVPVQALQSQAGREQVLARLKSTLDSTVPTIADTVLAQALEGSNKALDEAKVQTSLTLDKVALAFKQSLTDSITALYKVALGIVLLAWILTFLMPEAPMRMGGMAGGRPPAPVE